MKFFFPDSQDQIDPAFDLLTEERSALKVRQRDDLYVHEALSEPVIDGLLVSKAIVDGVPGAAGKYTLAQRHRLYRVGVREFFRLDGPATSRIETMGDCGAFTYVRDEVPPYTPDQVIDFYQECGFDLGISIDHVILGYDLDNNEEHADWLGRQILTLDLAAEFLARCRARHAQFVPVGVAQGWSPQSYSHAVVELEKIGYSRIAIGGMVPLKDHQILDCLRQISTVCDSSTQLHLLGVTRCARMPEFAALGVTSFDSTSAFRQAFKDDKDNYHTARRTYTALRVPQTDGNPKLKALIQAGQVAQRAAAEREQTCLRLLREYDVGAAPIDDVLDALRGYQETFDGRRDYSAAYREILEESPWKECECGICAKVGIDVAIFRGSERNKRRGFHNVYAFRQRLNHELRTGSAA